MTLTFDNIVASSAILSSHNEAKILSSSKTRLGGQIMHLQITPQKQAYAKIGTGFEKREIMREYRNIQALQRYLPVPQIYDYVSTNDQALIILEEMPGNPLHTMISSLGRKTSLMIIKNIMEALNNIPKIIENNFEIAHSFELDDIKSLIDNNLIRQDDFTKLSKGLMLQDAYIEIRKNLYNHSMHTITHGDLCLPNILVTIDGEWSLIDWGKGGLGDFARDLSALEGSLERNIDKQAFMQVCEIMNVEIIPFVISNAIN